MYAISCQRTRTDHATKLKSNSQQDRQLQAGVWVGGGSLREWLLFLAMRMDAVTGLAGLDNPCACLHYKDCVEARRGFSGQEMHWGQINSRSQRGKDDSRSWAVKAGEAVTRTQKKLLHYFKVHVGSSETRHSPPSLKVRQLP